MHEHAEPVDDRGAPAAGRREQRRLERVVDEVGDDLARPQRARRDRAASAVRRPMPTGVAFTTSVGGRRRGGPIGPRRPSAPAASAAAAAAASAAPGARPSTRAPAPRERERDRRGPRRPRRARAPRAPAGRCPASRERAQEALAVGRVAGEPAVARAGSPCSRCASAAASAVSSSQRGRGVGLVRHRDRQADEAERAHRVERAAALAVGHLERDVDPVETERGVRGVVQDRRQRVPHRVADDAGEPRVAPVITASAGLPRAASMFALLLARASSRTRGGRPCRRRT